jgi:hypothetical protein
VKRPSTSWGSSEAIVAKASTSADPVSILSQKITAKLTIELLSVEKSCPVQIKPKVLFQFVMFCGFSCVLLILLRILLFRKR